MGVEELAFCQSSGIERGTGKLKMGREKEVR